MRKLSKSKMKCLTSAIVLTLFTVGALASVAGSAEAAGFISSDATFNKKLGIWVAGKNTLNITNTKKSGYKAYDNAPVAGGYAEKAKVSGKTVTLEGTTVKEQIWGGLTTSTAVEANKLIINSGKVEDASGGEGGTVTKNSVTINGGTIQDNVLGGNGLANATGNYVTLNGGSVGGDILGGQTEDGNAVQNRVIVNKGSVGQDVCGGLSESGNATGNGVVVNGAGAPIIKTGVAGGKSNGTDKVANNNYVIINNYTHDKTTFFIRGGEGPNASGNTLIFANSTLKEVDIYGGKAQNAANNNSVVLVGVGGSYSFTSPDAQVKQTLSGTKATTISGVLNGGVGKSSTENTLKVLGINSKVEGINTASFQNMQFYINDKIKYGSTMLSTTGTNAVNLSKTAVKVTMQGKPQGGTSGSINLLSAPNASLTAPKSQSIEVQKGKTITVNGKVGLDSTKKKLVLTISKISGNVNENGKSLVESRAAAAAVVNNAADFLLDQGLNQAKNATQLGQKEGTSGFVPFAAMGGGKFKYSTGSHIDIKSWNAAVGLAKAACDCVYGVAVEHGRGDYDSYLDNGNHAEGDLKATGGVLFAEVKKESGVHYDAALRAGRISTDYNNDAGVSYDDRVTYLGFSLGGGKEFSVNDKACVDVYGRLAYSHTAGSDVISSDGNENHFDAVDSKRVRVGARYVLSLNDKSKLYAGAAWQYEFDGDARGYIDGYGTPVPSLKGHSGMAELGYKLEAGKNLSLDFNVNGWAGKQKGVAGGIGLQWKF